MHRWDVHGFSERGLHRQVGITERAVVIVRLPVADADRCATHWCVGSHSPLNRRRIDERLETRTGLSICLRGVVEFVRVEIVAADHRNDLARFRVEGHHRALHGWNLREFNFQTAVLFVYLFDLELSQMSVFKLVSWLPATPTHIFWR